MDSMHSHRRCVASYPKARKALRSCHLRYAVALHPHRGAAGLSASHSFCYTGAVTKMKTDQVPPIRVTPEAMQDLKERATACDLTVTEYVRYRVWGKKVLTGEQLERVKQNEKLVD